MTYESEIKDAVNTLLNTTFPDSNVTPIGKKSAIRNMTFECKASNKEITITLKSCDIAGYTGHGLELIKEALKQEGIPLTHKEIEFSHDTISTFSLPDTEASLQLLSRVRLAIVVNDAAGHLGVALSKARDALDAFPNAMKEKAWEQILARADLVSRVRQYTGNVYGSIVQDGNPIPKELPTEFGISAGSSKKAR